MTFFADFHVHSRYSIATSKQLDFPNLHMAAQIKGVGVVGTGDATHPQWLAEARETLVPAGGGLYRLKADIARACDERVPRACRMPVHFILTGEISNVYKKGGKTRKNHNLVFLPDMETALRYHRRLDRIGNVRSDGRPILGLDARNLLELTLEVSERAFLVPAHIWTPWFSVFGSQSGFDSLYECFEDLTGHVFAAETGLSSDPEMNWRVSGLDHLTLISNSDAHSPTKLGREANGFDTGLTFDEIRSAMETGDPERFKGTVEFYPQEGKYHLDGHRKCGVCLEPSETAARGGKCPVCGRPVTRGVLHRVEELADREAGIVPPRGRPFHYGVPLADILAEILQVGAGAKKVRQAHRKVVERLGNEFEVLFQLPEDEIDGAGIPLLGEAVGRVRRRKIELSPGYDGEYGRIRIFGDGEREAMMGQRGLFRFSRDSGGAGPGKSGESGVGASKTCRRKTPPPAEGEAPASPAVDDGGETARPAPSAVLNDAQARAVRSSGRPLMIVAGPGTGKTLTLTRRMAHMITERGIPPGDMLALTFTNKAAEEMRTRLEGLLGNRRALPFVGTFHSLCLHLSTDRPDGKNRSVIGEDWRRQVVRDAVRLLELSEHRIASGIRRLSGWISDAKLRMIDPESYADRGGDVARPVEFAAVYHAYQRLLDIQGLCDYDDLIMDVVRRLESDPGFRNGCRERYPFVLVDEYQDLNEGQYRLVRALAPPESEICVIGDPNQSIYGFRGSSVAYFRQFRAAYPDTETIRLSRSYRSTETILAASGRLLAGSGADDPAVPLHSGIDGRRTIGWVRAPSPKGEAVAVGKIIEQMVGGGGFHAMDFGKVPSGAENASRSFGDFAVLFRTSAPVGEFSDVLQSAGIPCQVASRANLMEDAGVFRTLSLLKVLEGLGSFVDLDATFDSLVGGRNQKILEIFKFWSYQRGLETEEALHRARKFPIPRMKSAGQRKIVVYGDRIARLRRRLEGRGLEDKLVRLVEESGLPETGGKAVDGPLGRLFAAAAAHRGDTASFLTAMALETDTDLYEAMTQKVALMTMHAAKGLEFPVVFISGCEKDNIPFRGPDGKPADVAEERRLLYVAMTRAREILYLTASEKRRVFGTTMERKPSPFLSDIGASLIQTEIVSQPTRRPGRQLQLKLF